MLNGIQRENDSVEFRSIGERIWQWGQTENEAISTNGSRITYRELTQKADLLAKEIEKAAGRGGIVAVATSDSLRMIVAALAAWRAGCAYLPIDPAGPEMRIRQMLREAGVRVVAADREAETRLRSRDWSVINFDIAIAKTEETCRGDAGTTVERWETKESDLAYVIYTSGSTGEPKGVAVTHANLRHLAEWHRQAFGTNERDCGIQFASLTFDAAVLETWPLLAAGATLYLAQKTIALTPVTLRDVLVRERITICFAVTPVAEQLIALDWPAATRLRHLLTGADKLREFARPGLPFQLINNYGPTECTVLVTSGAVPSEAGDLAEPTIGSPIAGTSVYVLNESLGQLPDGECGQLGITGASVSAGYVGQPELTRERFVKCDWLNGLRMYLTGDLGKKLKGGDIEFCGRIDDQIKIRGYRIEPGEIVSALRSHPSVAAAVAKAVSVHGQMQLVVYLVLHERVKEAELRRCLSGRLPSYMIPDQFVELAEFPITGSGKVDMLALPMPNETNALEAKERLAELENEIQGTVAAILSKLLGGRSVALDENFFRIGGHSLLAAQLIARIRSAFSVDLSLRAIFESPTVAGLSAQIEKQILETLEAVPAERLQ